MIEEKHRIESVSKNGMTKVNLVENTKTFFNNNNKRNRFQSRKRNFNNKNNQLPQ